MIDILYVELHPLFKGGIAPAVYLPKTRDTGAHAEAATMPVLVKTFVVPQRKRSGPYQTHVTLQDVKKLGHFVDTSFSQNHSNGRDSWIIFNLENRATDFVEVFYLGYFALGISDHGPELIQAKSSFVESYPLLPK